MSTNIFLGFPPSNIKEWIEKNYKPSEPENPMLKVPLHFTANEDGSSVSLVCYHVYEGGFIDSWCEFEYSFTGKDDDWSEYTTGQVVHLNEGETVYFRCPREKDDTLNQNKNGLSQYADYGNGWYEAYEYHYFVMEGSIKADGNIQFLLENTGTKMDVTTCCYHNMFYGCTSLTQAPELPATTLADYCYITMFSGCTSLTQSPLLPATTLASNCYQYMFSGCTSLTQAPALPAETLADSCYSNMFNSCSSLTQAPELPATTLADYCYQNMFVFCKSLTQAPELPATTLADYCYELMFYGCTSLNSVNVNFSTWDPSSATDYWLSEVAAEGTFACPAALPDTPRDISHIPVGWTRTDKQ